MGNCTNLDNESELNSTLHRTVATVHPAAAHTSSALVIACSTNFNTIETNFLWTGEHQILPAAYFSTANHTINPSHRISTSSVQAEVASHGLGYSFLFPVYRCGQYTEVTFCLWNMVPFVNTQVKPTPYTNSICRMNLRNISMEYLLGLEMAKGVRFYKLRNLVR